MKLKNIFFDFDGVLADSVSIKTMAFGDMFAQYGEDIKQKVIQFHLDNGGMSRFEKFKYWYKTHLAIDIDDEKMKELAQEFSDRVVEGVVNSPEVNGAIAFLEKYHRQLNCWIITGTPTEEIDRIIYRRGMSTYFVELCGSPKKKNYWTEYLIDKYNVKREETIFLGDAMSDYNASVHSKLSFALRTYPDNEELFKDYNGNRFKDFIELEEQLVKLNCI